MKTHDFDFIEFHKNVQLAISDAQSIATDIEHFELDTMQIPIEDILPWDGEENDFNKERLSESIESIVLKFKFAFEFLGLEKLSTSFDSELKKYEKDFSELEFIPYVHVFHSPVLWVFRKYLKAMTSHIPIEGRDESEHQVSRRYLEQILRGTPKILSDRKIDPTNEKEVRKEVYSLMIHIFPDTVREIPIAKVSKTYKPDIGIKSLKCAIEYKFVDSEKEAKSTIGGIFEDIKGYEGSEDWRTFYAVIYMTDMFLTQHQVEAEFELSKVDRNWKPIIVYGKGARK